MKRLSYPIIAAILTGLILAGCQEGTPVEATPPDASTTVTERSANETGPPAESGIVVRTEFAPAFIVFANPEEQLISISATEDGFFCSPPTAVEPVSSMEVDTPAGPLHVLHKANPHFTRVFGPATVDDLFADFCGFMAHGPLLAEGPINLMFVDNDALLEGPGANAFGFKGQGTLTDIANGGSVHFSLLRKLAILPDGEFKVLARIGPTLGSIGN